MSERPNVQVKLSLPLVSSLSPRSEWDGNADWRFSSNFNRTYSTSSVPKMSSLSSLGASASSVS